MGQHMIGRCGIGLGCGMLECLVAWVESIIQRWMEPCNMASRLWPGSSLQGPQARPLRLQPNVGAYFVANLERLHYGQLWVEPKNKINMLLANPNQGHIHFLHKYLELIWIYYSLSKLRSLCLLHSHIGFLFMLIIESIMVTIFCVHSLISFKHKSFWHPFLEAHLASYTQM